MNFGAAQPLSAVAQQRGMLDRKLSLDFGQLRGGALLDDPPKKCQLSER